MKKEYKKILVNGDKIQEKFDDSLEWQKTLDRVLTKYNIIDYFRQNFLVLVNGEKNVYTINKILDNIASKNASNVYLTHNNTILFKNEDGVEIEIIKELKDDDEIEKILDGE